MRCRSRLGHWLSHSRPTGTSALPGVRFFIHNPRSFWRTSRFGGGIFSAWVGLGCRSETHRQRTGARRASHGARLGSDALTSAATEMRFLIHDPRSTVSIANFASWRWIEVIGHLLSDPLVSNRTSTIRNRQSSIHRIPVAGLSPSNTPGWMLTGEVAGPILRPTDP